ncbi:MAG: flagellar motor switch protein FliM [Gammaproteobacteria bacterium 39-13]|nr:flagellar motor switch protein FliM [Gammaproteobacteria bacterium]OJV86582.1 MAG: flagellar motor switch protein FliM [Gammaproteobacteria bacterium 39-13]
MDPTLNQDELDSLLNAEGTKAADYIDPTVPRQYDLANHDKNIYNRISTLGLINEKFTRNLRVSLYNILRKSVEVSIQSLDICKFEEYSNSLAVPTSINMIKMHPLKGTALFVADSGLVFTVVENFFGGEGKVQHKTDAKEFTPTEHRIIKLMLDIFFKDLQEAWSSLLDIQFDYKGMESNPSMVNVFNLSEVIIISRFRIELEGGGGGDFQICLPYSMIEPIRELLSSGMKVEKDVSDEKWVQTIREEMLKADVELTCMLTQKKITLKEVMRFKAGDIIQIEIPEEIILKVRDVPIFTGNFGTFEGKYSVKIVDKIKKNAAKR